MLISNIGEFGLIRRIRKSIRLDRSVVVGPGDDCAVLKYDKKNYQLASCDMLVEGVDFSKRDDPYLVGRKALAVSISDIAACGGIPTHALVSLGLPRKSKLQRIDKICKGLTGLAKYYGINIIGGDLSRADKIIIDVSMLGVVEKKYLVLRSGAQRQDIIFVTGSLGGSIRGKHLRFVPRLREARYLVKNFKINSMIDISDGLVQDLSHIAEQSKMGAVIYEELVPLAKDARNLKEALYMGEDFELIFTLSRKEAKKLISQGDYRFRPIGQMSDAKKDLRMIDKNNKEHILQANGWRHF